MHGTTIKKGFIVFAMKELLSVVIFILLIIQNIYGPILNNSMPSYVYYLTYKQDACTVH